MTRIDLNSTAYNLPLPLCLGLQVPGLHTFVLPGLLPLPAQCTLALFKHLPLTFLLLLLKQASIWEACLPGGHAAILHG